ncbi:formate--tetrahydrofolate ligase [Agromyces sp. Marseille-P2726]|uniref:formate--tetrahydrofolate ligase n=1 Tax=Agromyces sp. Marseille-P2726 TaxID=2709132 RepID=UPI0035300374
MDDLAFARAAELRPIQQVAEQVGIPPEAIEPYGRHIAKVDVTKLTSGGRGRLVLVSGMSPTPAGEGKTTMSIGLADALARAGRRTIVALREPSIGPMLGMKGTGAGGGLSQVLPMEDINLHFTGDFHAITTANNTLVALIDNHLHHGNPLGIDPRRVTFRRVLDVNDRALRSIVIGLGGPTEGVPREAGFDITAASEIMAVLCLATDLADLKRRLAAITVGFTYDKQPVTAGDLNAEGALTALLVHAVKPNLVQTVAGTAAFVHGGPFGNIAHGCSSVIATSAARSIADVVVTEAGFGTDLGMEKYLHITTRVADTVPDAVVVVATLRALKMHGGVALADIERPDPDAVEAGLPNLERHVENVRAFGLEPVVAINTFPTDTDEERERVLAWARSAGVPAAVADIWARGGGGDGGDELAAAVLEVIDRSTSSMSFAPLNDHAATIEQQIRTITRRIYGAEDVEFTPAAWRRMAEIERNGWTDLPVCMAKTQYSFSDDATRLGVPEGFTIRVRDLVPRTGAGFVVALTGTIMTMPGLPRVPASERFDVDDEGRIVGLS